MAGRSRCKANAGGGADPDLAGLGWALGLDLARGLCVAVTITLIGPEIVGGETDDGRWLLSRDFRVVAQRATSRLVPRSGGTRPKAPGGIYDAEAQTVSW